jgi:hypothetical protein
MKKEIIKPFDLASYKNGAKVKTRDGHEVRIICTDAKNEYYPIIGLVINNGDEHITLYTLEGKVDSAKSTIHAEDLVIVEEVEEPEFWSDCTYNTFDGFIINTGQSISKIQNISNIKLHHDVYATEKQAKSALAMARISQIMANDIENFGGVITDEEWENAEWKFVIYRNGSFICKTAIMNDYSFLAFHTEKQRDLFLEKYPQLVKDYLMIPDEETK